MVFIDGNKTILNTDYYLHLLQIENNWKKQKKWLEEEIKHLEKSRYVSFNEYGENKLRIFKDFQFKIQEIESGKNE